MVFGPKNHMIWGFWAILNLRHMAVSINSVSTCVLVITALLFWELYEGA